MDRNSRPLRLLAHEYRTNGALVTDPPQPADEEQIWSIWKGNARVKR